MMRLLFPCIFLYFVALICPNVDTNILLRIGTFPDIFSLTLGIILVSCNYFSSDILKDSCMIRVYIFAYYTCVVGRVPTYILLRNCCTVPHAYILYRSLYDILYRLHYVNFFYMSYLVLYKGVSLKSRWHPWE